MLLLGIRDKSLLDWVSLIHFSTGLLMGLIFSLYLNKKFDSFKKRKNYFLSGFFLIFFWELFEIIMRHVNLSYQQLYSNSWLAPWMNFLFDFETPINIFSDILMDSLGLTLVFYLAKNKFTTLNNSRQQTQKT